MTTAKIWNVVDLWPHQHIHNPNVTGSITSEGQIWEDMWTLGEDTLYFADLCQAAQLLQAH